MKIDKRITYVSGLPRAGSTLMCQLLGQHPDIYGLGHSSPLFDAINQFRRSMSENSFLLSQLDGDLERVQARLLSATRGLINGWFDETERPVVVDKNRGWLCMVEMLNLIDPDFRMIVCVRDLRQIMGSIEAQHAKTRLLDFPDHLDSHSISQRMSSLFNDNGLVGEALRSIEQMQDIEDEGIRSKICYVSYEQLATTPADAMAFIYDWLDIADFNLDPDDLVVTPTEADSYYRYKYPHATHAEVSVAEPHDLPVRIEEAILREFGWFYRQFYPEVALP
ncbi:MAG: sulfotransferase [Pseudomonadota bacterium]